MEKILLTVLIAIASLSASAANRHEVYGGSAVTHQDTIGVFLGYAFPKTPLNEGVKELKVVPAYISMTSTSEGQDEDLNGAGIAVSYFRSYNENWGWSVLGAYGHLSGTTLGIREITGAAAAGFSYGNGTTTDGTTLADHRFDKSGYGLQLAAAGIYDPMNSGSSFRLPMMLGIGLLVLDHKTEGTAPSQGLSTNLTLTTENNQVIPGIFFGISGQFNTGPVRWSPYLMAQFRLSESDLQNSTVVDSSNTVLFSEPDDGEESFFPSIGLGIMYVPWKLEFNFHPSLWVLLDGEDEPQPTVMSLTRTFHF